MLIDMKAVNKVLIALGLALAYGIGTIAVLVVSFMVGSEW